jgi:hypothetical protein
MTETKPTYELEVFLSTDGKQTVHVKFLDNESVTEGLTKAATIYDNIVKKYGLQPSRSGGFAKKAPPTPTGMKCKVHGADMFLNKNGKPYHMDRDRSQGDQFCNGKGFPSESQPYDSVADDVMGALG